MFQGMGFEVFLHYQLTRKGFLVISDIYLENSGFTKQLDLVALGNGKIYVIEAKDYAANIEVFEDDKAWVAYYKKKSFKIYNPIYQNRSHVKELERQGFTNVENCIVFSDTAVLSSKPEHVYNTSDFLGSFRGNVTVSDVDKLNYMRLSKIKENNCSIGKAHEDMVKYFRS